MKKKLYVHFDKLHEHEFNRFLRVLYYIILLGSIIIIIIITITTTGIVYTMYTYNIE